MLDRKATAISWMAKLPDTRKHFCGMIKSDFFTYTEKIGFMQVGLLLIAYYVTYLMLRATYASAMLQNKMPDAIGKFYVLFGAVFGLIYTSSVRHTRG
mmetsp:Transcript_33544/g.62349  ORF Transcript_33544/g.62349 Transcript_33544/m.62349 type:complete len:98 (+) Transcript_33544:610-903(+)